MFHRYLASWIALCFCVGIGILAIGSSVQAMKGWTHVSVVDTAGGTLRLTLSTELMTQLDTASGLIGISNNIEALNASNTSPLPPDVWGMAVGVLASEVLQELVPGEQPLTPQRVGEVLADQLAQGFDQTSFDSPQTVTIGGLEGVEFVGQNSQGDAFIIILQWDSGYLLATGVTAQGEFAMHQPVILSIIESAHYVSS